ncbi:beta-lactamase class A [Oceanobacillus limi]|uniref:Beta-lactamase class A n=1 Tax=Oceanobacillus limi TaxID=930131 RepID=A0A1I0CTE8_9BACI|nr:serine hydrolase [Oceanobacillus limi]SET22817.1 beta-lactamase class A [Oceanobacillus limi]
MKKLVVCIFSITIFSLFTVHSEISAEELNTTEEMIAFIEEQPGTMSFYYENINTGYKMYYNPEKVYGAASTVKMPMALYVMEQAAKGNVDLNEVKAYEGRHYSGGTGIIQYEDVGSEYTIKEIVENAMIHSDNVAYIMLLDRFGRGNLIDFMHELGGKYAYPDMQNVTTAKDMGMYSKALYEFSNEEELGAELVEILKNTEFNDAIPAGVPDLEVAHKIGYITNQLLFNDVGIVYDEDPYVLAVTTKGIPFDDQRETVAELTSIIHEEHEKVVMENFLDNIFNTLTGEGEEEGITDWYPIVKSFSNFGRITPLLF